jgi:DNA polymerase III subunit delta'
VVSSALQLLPWQGPVLQDALQNLSSAGALIHGAPGSGQLNLSMNLAKAWLCETNAAASVEGAMFDDEPMPSGPRVACGQCPSCHLVDTGHHPDLMVVLPDALLHELAWPHLMEALDKADKGEGKKKRLSQEIKVDAIREVVTFSQSTISRGVSKVVVVHPAERMNTVSANTLLKTLEEPPGSVRFLLSCGALQDVLPTVRSRCQAWHLPMPQGEQVSVWLSQQMPGLSPADALLLLQAAGSSPQAAVDLMALGWQAAGWKRLPRDIQQGSLGLCATWPLPVLLDSLQKVAHDMACVAVQGSPRYFPPEAMPKQAHLARVTAWAQELRQTARHAEHPFNAALKAESLLYQARRAMT